mmetsp:Transcript_101/g.274  ORF Transcript_101/g.274 Transcript_101/m.274 type:complete len:417 (+) Transcript_101:104-1354(+)
MKAANAPDFRQPLDLPADEPLWPVLDSQHPEVVHTVEKFLQIALFEPHVDRVVVLPDGVRLLQQEGAIPTALQAAVSKSSTIRGLLGRLGPDIMEGCKARLWHYGKPGAECEIRTGNKEGKANTLREVVDVLIKKEEAGSIPENAPLYISELRWCKKVPHPLVPGEKVKTATSCDVYDYTALARKMPFWERSEGGIFVGERGTGSGLHVDQCLWSNVGRNWCGHKLFAIWPWEERLSILDDVGKGAVFNTPVSERAAEYLSRAKVIALVRPGDVWVFSGGQPHMALCVGNGLNITAYESMVPAHPEAVTTLVRTNTADAHWKKCWMDDEDLDELYEDVVDALQNALEDPESSPALLSRLEDCAKAMREHGDTFCRELWDEAERGLRVKRSPSETPSGGGNSSSDEVVRPAAKKAKT